MADLIDTWGGSTSNVYVGLTAAHSYITSAIYDSTAWTDATTAQREAALIEATIQIDRGHYVGSRYYSDQRLEFPRSLDYGAYRHPFTEIGTPFSTLQAQMKNDVERACCYQALFVARNGGRNLSAERINAGIRSYSEKVGPIQEFVMYGQGQSGAAKAQLLDHTARDILARWREGRKIYRG